MENIIKLEGWWHPNKNSREKERRKPRRENYQCSRKMFRMERHEFPDRKDFKYSANLITTVKKSILHQTETRKPQRQAGPHSIGLLTATLEARRQKNTFKILREIMSSSELFTHLQQRVKSKDIFRQARSQKSVFSALILQRLEGVLYQNEKMNKKWEDKVQETRYPAQERGQRSIQKDSETLGSKTRKPPVRMEAGTQRAAEMCLQENWKQRVPGSFWT